MKPLLVDDDWPRPCDTTGPHPCVTTESPSIWCQENTGEAQCKEIRSVFVLGGTFIGHVSCAPNSILLWVKYMNMNIWIWLHAFPRFKSEDSVWRGVDTFYTEIVPVMQYPIGVTESYAVSLHLSTPLCTELLCAELLCHLLFSALPQRCQDRAPSPLHAAGITLTIQPSVEDIMTCLITAMMVHGLISFTSIITCCSTPR